jgi:glutathione synthase/RimK-type ligase-like ATP-grasp enzyme
VILAISSNADLHTRAVLQKLEERGESATVVDLSEFPRQARLRMSYGADTKHRFELQLQACCSLDLRRCTAIWWRRPQPLGLHPELKDRAMASFAYTEAHEAITGLWQSLDTFWINNPTRDEVAARKAYQLRLAQQVGLTIPRTLITNDPDAARAFANDQGADATVYKAFSATVDHWRETRVLRPNEVERISSVAYAPVIFQEYIPASVDLRITFVHDRFFPAAIYSQETDYKVDYRMNMARARIEAHTLPIDVEEGLCRLMQCLGLEYAAIDMRLTPDGRYVFLEVNPAGQWLFVEERTGQPITDALASALAS